jgi:hypothetical protein
MKIEIVNTVFLPLKSWLEQEEFSRDSTASPFLNLDDCDLGVLGWGEFDDRWIFFGKLCIKGNLKKNMIFRIWLYGSKSD